jgi:hypothetical protein
MTRKQVARRLGKSIATVRRIEGMLLHPARDERGVHRFDPDEVEALALDVDHGVVSLSSEFDSLERDARVVPHGCSACATLRNELQDVRAKLARQDRAHRLAVEQLRTEHDREAAAYKREARELVVQVEELLATIG